MKNKELSNELNRIKILIEQMDNTQIPPEWMDELSNKSQPISDNELGRIDAIKYYFETANENRSASEDHSSLSHDMSVVKKIVYGEKSRFTIDEIENMVDPRY